MSVAKPQNRAEFKKHILTKLGAPVLEINVADEQMDVCIEDAFQFFNERNHFNGIERVYLTAEITREFERNFRGHNVHWTKQESGYKVHEHGMVKELTLVDPGSGYRNTSESYEARTLSSPTREYTLAVNVGLDEDDHEHFDVNLATNIGGSVLGPDIIVQSGTLGVGSGLTVKVFPDRSIHNGLVRVEPYHTGSNYMVGDYVTIAGGKSNSVWMVTRTEEESEFFGVHPIREQRNFIVLPEDVVGVTNILKGRSGMGLGGIIPGGMVFPMLFGGMNGNSCDSMGFGLSSYYIMQSYLSLIEFMFHPPKMYNFNQRTHHLHIDGDLGEVGTWLALEVMMKPSPDVYPDLWNDLWLKEFGTALVKAQWGRNLTKYNQVQLPGGIVINGERILADAQKELETIRTRFSMDWMDPPLDAVG